MREKRNERKLGECGKLEALLKLLFFMTSLLRHGCKKIVLVNKAVALSWEAGKSKREKNGIVHFNCAYINEW